MTARTRKSPAHASAYLRRAAGARPGRRGGGARARVLAAKAAARHLVHEANSDAPHVVATEDGFVVAADGRRYIDFVMGWCVGNFGWDDAGLRAVARDHRGPDYVAPEHRYAAWGELAELLVELAPRNLKRCARATGGSEAVDLALQAAQLHTGRRKFLSVAGSYHGNTLATLSIGDEAQREHFANLLPHCHLIEPPLDLRGLRKVETRLRRKDVAAVILEPISINLGVLIPDAEFMTGLQRACRRTGTLLVADEVACGFGRTGKVFACEHYALEPDVLCLAKAITGGYAPLGAVLMTPAVARSLEEQGSYWSTYGWHPRSVAVAIANLRNLQRDRARLLAHVATMSAYFAERLAQMPFRETPRLRIKGLAIAVGVGDEGYAAKIGKRCQGNGLLVSVQDENLLLLPALNVDADVAREGLDRLEASL